MFLPPYVRGGIFYLRRRFYDKEQGLFIENVDSIRYNDEFRKQSKGGRYIEMSVYMGNCTEIR